MALRTHHPDVDNFISKYDYSDAYRRIAHAARAAMQTILVVGVLTYLSLRLTFGECRNPPSWCLFSEIVTDMVNELAQCAAWDPAMTFIPAQVTVPPPVRLPPEVTREGAKTMSALSPVTSGGRIDGLIDDLISVFLDTPENLVRYTQAVPLAMELTSSRTLALIRSQSRGGRSCRRRNFKQKEVPRTRSRFSWVGESTHAGC